MKLSEVKKETGVKFSPFKVFLRKSKAKIQSQEKVVSDINKEVKSLQKKLDEEVAKLSLVYDYMNKYMWGFSDALTNKLFKVLKATKIDECDNYATNLIKFIYNGKVLFEPKVPYVVAHISSQTFDVTVGDYKVLATYDSPYKVEFAIQKLIKAIEHGDETFVFPEVSDEDELRILNSKLS